MVRWIKGREKDEMFEEILVFVGNREIKFLVFGLIYLKVWFNCIWSKLYLYLKDWLVFIDNV